MTQPEPALPDPIPGFEAINRYWDRRSNVVAAKILPGQYYVTLRDEVVVTVLGSCVAACIRDVALGIGGMNHFMLPASRNVEGWDRTCASTSNRYGTFAMENLINEILKQGGRRERLEVKLFGGGRVLASVTDVGARNIAFVRDFVRRERLVVVSEDLGATFPRKVRYQPASGRARVKKLRNQHNDTILERESAYRSELEKADSSSGSVELF